MLVTAAMERCLSANLACLMHSCQLLLAHAAVIAVVAKLVSARCSQLS